MALENIKTFEMEGNSYTITFLPATITMKCIWKLTKPATSIINGPLKLILELFSKFKNNGLFSDGFTIDSILNSDIGDLQDLVQSATNAFKEVFMSMDENEFVELIVSLFHGMSIHKKGFPIQVVRTVEDYDKILSGVSPTTIMILAFEVMRFNKFPFLSRVTKDFGELLNQINTLIEGLQSGESTEND